MNIISLIQNSPEWHAFRRTSLGASTASIILGENPWRTPYDLYEEMVLEKSVPLNEAMKRGMGLEETARRWCEDRFKMSLFPVVVKHHFIPFMHASFDGLSIDGELAVEIKCPGEKSHEETKKTGKIPYYYQLQMQHQMEVGNLDHMYYISYRDDSDVIVIQLNRDDVIIEDILLKERKFYYEHVVEKIPPFNKKEKVDLSEKLEDHQLEALEINFKNLKEIREKIKHLQEIESYLKESIIQKINDESCVIGEFKAVKYFVKGSIDYDSIPELNDVDLEAFRKPGRWQWKLS